MEGNMGLVKYGDVSYDFIVSSILNWVNLNL